MTLTSPRPIKDYCLGIYACIHAQHGATAWYLENLLNSHAWVSMLFGKG